MVRQAALGALLALTACGAEVRFERTTDIDGAGAGTGGNAPNPLQEACETYCDARTACGTDGSCLDTCLEMSSYLGVCERSFEALLQCVASQLQGPPSCGDPDCSTERDELLACIYPAWPCDTRECWTGVGSEPAMRCEVACGGVLYESRCGQSSAAFPRDCVCLIDGATVGQCQNLTANGSSSFDCCSAFFAESE